MTTGSESGEGAERCYRGRDNNNWIPTGDPLDPAARFYVGGGGSAVATVTHHEEQVLTVDRILTTEAALLCRVPVTADRRTYLCRIEGYERLVDDDGDIACPGRAPLDRSFWVILPSTAMLYMDDEVTDPIQIVENRQASTLILNGHPFVGDAGILRVDTLTPSVSARPEGWTWFLRTVGSGRFECENLGPQIRKLTEDVVTTTDDAVKLSEALQIAMHHHAPERAFCAASFGRDDYALQVLEEAEVAFDKLGDPQPPSWRYGPLVLLHTARGTTDQAVAALGRWMHMSHPDWRLGSFDELPDVEPESPLGWFLRERRPELEQHWPVVLREIERRLEVTAAHTGG